MKRLRIAVVPGPFPLLSTTFILDQIVGLLELGHDVEILAQRPSAGTMHADFVERGVAERTRFWLSGVRTPLDVARRTSVLLARDPHRAVASIGRSLDPREFGVMGASGHLWCLASEVLLHAPYDVVLCHFGEHGLRAEMLRRLGAIDAPIVTVFHGYDVSRYVRSRGAAVYARLFASGELMLPISEHWRRRLIELGCEPAKVRVHRMGIDPRSLPFRSRGLDPGERPRILSVARLTEKKGLEYALRALGALERRGVAFDYDIVGEGPLRESLEALARSLGLGARVTFHGGLPRERVRTLRDRAHVFLAPSVTAPDGDQEGIPVAIMEAMAAGMPVVSTRHTGIPELVDHGATGYLTDERDVPGLAGAIARVLDEAERWPAMGRAARRIVEERHDVRVLDAELAAVLEDVAARYLRR